VIEPVCVAYVDLALVEPTNRDRVRRFNALGRYRQVGIAPAHWVATDMGRTYKNTSTTDDFRFLPTIGPSIPTKHMYRFGPLMATLRELRPALLHAELETYSPGGWQMALAARLLSIPLVMGTWQNNRQLIHRLLGWPIQRTCSVLVAGTDQIAQQWIASRPQMPVVPLGFESSRFQPVPPGDRPRHRGRIGYLGRLVQGKGVDLLIKAAAAGGSWTLIIDSGPGRQALEGLASELGVADRVEFVDVTYQDVPEFLGKLDALVLPSRTKPRWREQFGRVLIESMAVGTPVIGSSSGSIPGLIGDAGLIFPEEDFNALGARIDKLLSDRQLWLELRGRGLRRAQDFSWESVGRATEAVYDGVLRASS
jgi:glycosyltransferase involved in cell wall biosynthesis